MVRFRRLATASKKSGFGRPSSSFWTLSGNRCVLDPPHPDRDGHGHARGRGGPGLRVGVDPAAGHGQLVAVLGLRHRRQGGRDVRQARAVLLGIAEFHHPDSVADCLESAVVVALVVFLLIF